MFISNRTISLLFRTPVAKSPATMAAAASQPQMIELTTMSSPSSGPSRPSAGRRMSSSRAMSSSPYPTSSSSTPYSRPRAATGSSSLHMIQSRGYASNQGKKELYSDEGGSTGAGTDDVAHTDAAFDGSKTNPEQAAKGVEAESGKDFTNRSPANKNYSQTKPGSQGDKNGKGTPLETSQTDAKKGN